MYLPLQFRFSLMLLVILISVFLVFIVYKKNGVTLLNNVFLFSIISSVVWLVATYLALHPHFSGNSIFFARLSVAFGSAMSGGVFWLSYLVVRNNLPKTKFFFGLSVVSVIIFILCLTPYVFMAAPSSPNPNLIGIVPGPGMVFFAVYSMAAVLGGIYFLILGVKMAVGIEKKRFQFVLYGYIGMHLGTILLVMLPIILFHNASFVQFGSFYVLFFLICTAIAILRYQLFNIQIIATEVLILILNSFLFVQLALSDSLVKIVGNGFIFILALLTSYLLLKTSRRQQKQYEEQIHFDSLIEVNRQLQFLDRQKTEFLNIAAHQLRTPASIINSYVAMLKDGDYGSVPQPIGEVLDHIDQSNQWLVRLADEFLNIAHLESDQVKYHFTDVSLHQLMQSVVRELRSRAEQKGLQLNLEQPEGVTLHCDEEKMRNVVFNFVENAIKYSDHGGVQVSVGVQDNGVNITVKDEGMGFTPEEAKEFFQKFHRGESAKQVEVNTSTGLGLYIVRKFVEGHGGRVWAKSEGLGNGSEFGLWVPLKQEKV